MNAIILYLSQVSSQSPSPREKLTQPMQSHPITKVLKSREHPGECPLHSLQCSSQACSGTQLDSLLISTWTLSTHRNYSNLNIVFKAWIASRQSDQTRCAHVPPEFLPRQLAFILWHQPFKFDWFRETKLFQNYLVPFLESALNPHASDLQASEFAAEPRQDFHSRAY